MGLCYRFPWRQRKRTTFLSSQSDYRMKVRHFIFLIKPVPYRAGIKAYKINFSCVMEETTLHCIVQYVLFLFLSPYRQMVDLIGLIDWLENVTHSSQLYTGVRWQRSYTGKNYNRKALQRNDKPGGAFCNILMDVCFNLIRYFHLSDILVRIIVGTLLSVLYPHGKALVWSGIWNGAPSYGNGENTLKRTSFDKDFRYIFYGPVSVPDIPADTDNRMQAGK